MSQKTLTWLLIFSVILNISTIVTFSYFRWIKPGTAPAPAFRSPFKGPLHEHLGLTESQYKQIHELRQNLMKDISPLRIQISLERRELIEALKPDTVDVEKVKGQVDRISDLQKQIQQQTITNLLQHQSILTKEQREKFISVMTQKMYLDDYRMEKGHRKRFFKGSDSLPRYP